MHILNFGTQLQPGGSINVRPGVFFSPNTILDADLIFLNVQSIYSNMAGNPSKLNVITSNQKETYENGINLRKREFEEYFKLGRTLILTSPIFYPFKYQISESSEKGSLDIWESFHIKPPNSSNNSGQNIETIDDAAAQAFFHDFKTLLHYNKRIDKSNGIPLFFIKGTKYVVGEYYTVSNGLIMILPEFRQPHGNQIESFVGLLNNLSYGLINSEKSEVLEFPAMVEQYSTTEELQEQIKLTDLEKKRQEIDEKILNQKSILDDFKWMKSLFTSDGDLLEDACEKVLEKFGFEVEKPEGNRDDLIIKQGSHVGVVEVKGVTKSAAEKHAAQLQKWVSDFHITNGKNPKGILIVNTFKNLPLDKRTDDDFPDQMMKYVKQMEHCLISGLQLLSMYIDFRNKKLKKSDVLKVLFETVGEVKYTDKIENYLTKNEVQQTLK